MSVGTSRQEFDRQIGNLDLKVGVTNNRQGVGTLRGYGTKILKPELWQMPHVEVEKATGRGGREIRDRINSR